MYKCLITLALVACLGLSATAAPSQSDTANNNALEFSNLVCEACESVVEQVQANLPEMRPKLDQLCQYCGSPESNQKCMDKLHELEDKVEHMSKREVCTMVGLCQPKQSKWFYDFSGQF